LKELRKRDEENFEAQIEGLEEEKQVLDEKKVREKGNFEEIKGLTSKVLKRCWI
jgi:hypothetical protein